MKRTLSAILTLAIIAPVLSTLSFADDKSIYGEDDRMELFKASPETARLADSVVSIWATFDVQYDEAAKAFSLNTLKFADKSALCPGERFRNQPAGDALCSGSLVGDDLILTAGHCVTNQSKCNGIKIVFGFARKTSVGKTPAKIGEGEVYSCKQLISSFPGGEGELDYALIRLDRPVTGHEPLEINRDPGIKKGDKVMAIGHPAGLPLKIAPGAVRDASPEVYFVTDLDTFGGNSGSPVFNMATGLIEGILVRGDKDIKNTPAGCNTMATSAQDGGRGEDVTRISAIESLIPKLAKESRPEKTAFQAVNTAIDVPTTQVGLTRFDINFQ